MLMKIAHHNDGKEKWQSHTCYLFNDSDGYHEFDITNIRGYGDALEKMLYETDVLDNDIIEVDCLGKKMV